jgi:hypothetical protein
MSTNTFGAGGTASHIPESDDLWLVVRSGIEGRWYPDARLAPEDGAWRLQPRELCPASGPQELEVWLVPQTADGELIAYRKALDAGQAPGLNSMPPTATLEAVASISVARKRSPHCGSTF